MTVIGPDGRPRGASISTAPVIHVPHGDPPIPAPQEETLTDEERHMIHVELPDVETTDIGEFCVECRRYVGEDTEWFATRQPHVHENSDKSRIVGFRCSDCQPMEGTLMEPIVAALIERRWDEEQVRRHMKRIGSEELFAALVAPMLDMMETLLQLERK